MSRPRVLVTPRSMSVAGGSGLGLLEAAGVEVVLPSPGRQPSPGELVEHLPGAVGWVAGVEKIDASVLAHADALRVISRNGAGSDGIDADAARLADVAVLTARGANARGVAELALGLMVMGLRGMAPAMRSVREGGWERTLGREAEGRVLGIVGLGAIGRTLARLAASLGMQVIGHDPFVDSFEDVEVCPLDDLLGRAEVVSLHVPPSPDGPLLGAREVALLRPDVVLLNTARSTVIDEDALLARLYRGEIAMYAVDAFASEPPPQTALITHERVVATPHLGAATQESSVRAAVAAVENLLNALGLPIHA